MPIYLRDSESAALKLGALELMNTIPELGEPAGQTLRQALEGLDPGPPNCAATSGSLQLISSPWCEDCELTLDRRLPTDQLAATITNIESELGTKNRQLSVILVESIVQGRRNERLEDFLKIVQASDLSAISITLTPELVTFIRGMLV